MAQITKAAFDAAVKQAKEEARREYAATISRLKAEVSDVRIMLDAEREAAKRSIQNEIDKSKAGGWRSRPKTIAAFVLLIVLVAWMVFFLASKARAAESCSADIPDDMILVCCDGQINAYSGVANQLMAFNLPCGRST